MTDEFWKALASAVATVAVSVILRGVQLGERRRRLRREIQAELELLGLISDWPEHAARVRRRADFMLRQYAPDREKLDERWSDRVMRWLLVPLSLGLVVAWGLSNHTWITFAALLCGTPIAIVTLLSFADRLQIRDLAVTEMAAEEDQRHEHTDPP